MFQHVPRPFRIVLPLQGLDEAGQGNADTQIASILQFASLAGRSTHLYHLRLVCALGAHSKDETLGKLRTSLAQ